MGDILGGTLKFQIFFGVLEIPNIFWGRTVEAGPKPTYEEKNESTPPPPGTCICLSLHSLAIPTSVWFEIIFTFKQSNRCTCNRICLSFLFILRQSVNPIMRKKTGKIHL